MTGRTSRVIAALLALVLLSAACSSKTASSPSAIKGSINLQVSNPGRCEFLAGPCLLPFPNDHFTVADPATPTGRRVNLARDSMPKNTAGVAIDPTEWNRNDGFSPGGPIFTVAQGVDLKATGAAPITDMAASLKNDAPVVLIDTVTGKRQAYWTELDAGAQNPSERAFFIRPTNALAEGHRYVVALRRLKDGAGSVLTPTDAFRAYRDHLASQVPEVEVRRPAMERVFADLEKAKVGRKDLYLAWDFTVASEQSLAGRLLHMRDDAFASLQGGVPPFAVTAVTDNVDANVARRVNGTFEVPSYMTGRGEPGSRMQFGPDGKPARNGSFTANFTCIVPRQAAGDGTRPATPARGVAYGHGLLGSADEVRSFGALANSSDIVFCATDWVGMAKDDVPNVLRVIQDGSNFPTLADRLQQGILNMQFLARLLKDERGFASNAAFRAGLTSAPVIKTGEVFFNGNSQGGIMGGAATAVSTEWTRAVLGVPAMNYSTLLSRSVDFDRFEVLSKQYYPNPLDRTTEVALFQMLWDRGEANGYAQHMTDRPYPGTPPHQVMLIEAFGDHQVANVATEVEARTVGARVHQPALAPGRSPDVTPMWGIPAVPGGRFQGSVLVMWDYGTPRPPLDNVPPRGPEYGKDPHSAGSKEPRVGQMASEFLKTDGSFLDTCDKGPCRSTANG